MAWHRVKKHMWELGPHIWPCRRFKFMFALRQGMRKQLHIVMACEQLGQSGFETVDHFNDEIY